MASEEWHIPDLTEIEAPPVATVEELTGETFTASVWSHKREDRAGVLIKFENGATLFVYQATSTKLVIQTYGASVDIDVNERLEGARDDRIEHIGPGRYITLAKTK